jgi:hypothetical protein
MLPIVLYASSHHVNASNAAMYVHRLHPILHHKLHDDHLQCLIADNPLAMTVVAGMGMKDMRMPICAQDMAKLGCVPMLHGTFM